MIPALVLAAAAGGAALFKAAFPGASVTESAATGTVTSASGFEAQGLGNTPEDAARAFLARYGAAFGVGRRQELSVLPTVPPGPIVRFQRRIEGFPVFDADIVVGTKSDSSVIVVNTSAVAAKVTGKARIPRAAAIKSAKAAIPNLKSSDPPHAEQGWRTAGHSVRPVWRVDFVAVRPPGDYRSYVDAETGKVLFRVDRRKTNSPGGIRAPKAELEPDSLPR
jgi:Zn-dependent metalloprotease